MEKNKILNEAIVLFTVVVMIISSTAVVANTDRNEDKALDAIRTSFPHICLTDGDLLWDNGMDEQMEGGWSMFDYSYAGANRSIIDDFEIPTGETWSIGKIQIIGGYYGNDSTGTGMVVSFREDDASTPGDYITTVEGTDWSEEWTGNLIFSINLKEYLTTYEFDPVDLTEGTYWVEVHMVADDNFYAEVVNYTTVGHLEECWLNWEYDGYFGNGTDYIGYPADLKYALYEPTPDLPEFDINVSGGLGVTATIENIGMAGATNVEATFTFTGGLILLPAGGTKTVAVGDIAAAGTGSANTFVFGIGKPVITVDVTCDEGVAANATYEPTLVFLFFVL